MHGAHEIEHSTRAARRPSPELPECPVDDSSIDDLLYRRNELVRSHAWSIAK